MVEIVGLKHMSWNGKLLNPLTDDESWIIFQNPNLSEGFFRKNVKRIKSLHCGYGHKCLAILLKKMDFTLWAQIAKKCDYIYDRVKCT